MGFFFLCFSSGSESKTNAGGRNEKKTAYHPMGWDAVFFFLCASGFDELCCRVVQTQMRSSAHATSTTEFRHGSPCCANRVQSETAAPNHGCTGTAGDSWWVHYNGVDKHRFTVDFHRRKLLFGGLVASSNTLLFAPLLRGIQHVQVQCNLRALQTWRATSWHAHGSRAGCCL